MKINISTIENQSALSEVKTSTGDAIVGGDGVTLDIRNSFFDGGPGAANASIKGTQNGYTTDIDAGNSLDGRPWHEASYQSHFIIGD